MINNTTIVLFLAILFISQRYFTITTLKKTNDSTPPLKDVGFKTLPHLRSPIYSHFIDIVLYSSLVFTYISLNQEQLRPFLISAFFIFLIRFICLFVTRFPHTGSDCNSKNTASFLVQSNECYTDYILSGHTSLFLLSLLHLREVYPTYAMPFLALFTVFVYLIVATRAHYTVDVVLAIIVTYCIYVIVGVKHNKVIV